MCVLTQLWKEDGKLNLDLYQYMNVNGMKNTALKLIMKVK